MKEVAGILYNDEPNEVKMLGKVIIRVYYPAVHDDEAAKSNLDNINRICTEIVEEAKHKYIELS